MRRFILILSLVMAGCVNAEPPYKYMSATDAQSYTGEVIIELPGKYRYVGGIKNGKRHGHGVLITYKGTVMYGEWVDGEQSGNGAVYTAAPFDSIKAGHYENSTLTGDAVMIIDGEAIEGPFGKFGIPHGKNVCTKDGVKKACEFNHGEKVE